MTQSPESDPAGLARSTKERGSLTHTGTGILQVGGVHGGAQRHGPGLGLLQVILHLHDAELQVHAPALLHPALLIHLLQLLLQAGHCLLVCRENEAGCRNSLGQKPRREEAGFAPTAAETGPWVAVDHSSGSHTLCGVGSLQAQVLHQQMGSPGAQSLRQRSQRSRRKSSAFTRGPESQRLLETLEIVLISALVTMTPKGERSFTDDPWRKAGLFQPAPHNCPNPSGTWCFLGPNTAVGLSPALWSWLDGKETQ